MNRTERRRYHTCLGDQLKNRCRAPMSIRERGVKCVLPRMVTSFLYWNARPLIRVTVVRRGMSNDYRSRMRITLESDVTRISECVTVINTTTSE